MIPPILFDIHIQNHNSKNVRIWFPFFLLWPILVLALLLLLPLAALSQIILSARGIKPLTILIVLLELFASMPGMSVLVNSKTNNSSVKVNFI